MVVIFRSTDLLNVWGECLGSLSVCRPLQFVFGPLSNTVSSCSRGYDQQLMETINYFKHLAPIIAICVEDDTSSQS